MDLYMALFYLLVLGFILMYGIGFYVALSEPGGKKILGIAIMIVAVAAVSSVTGREIELRHGNPMPFSMLKNNKEYIKEKNINNDLLLIRISEEEIKIIKDVPEAVSSLPDGSPFKKESVLSITSKEHFIAPLITKH